MRILPAILLLSIGTPVLAQSGYGNTPPLGPAREPRGLAGPA